MIEITVKTLDSQNHSFSVPDDVTVKQFKEKIFETLPIPVESQRLIYCGRVLQDDKKLNEYDVNGKVVHLVQRAPPQSAPSGGAGTANGAGARSGNWARRGSTRRIPFRSRLDGGNAMYLGAMAIPADVMDANGITTPPPSQSLSRSRLATARRMIRSAGLLLDTLDTPNAQAPSESNTPPEEAGNSESNGEAPLPTQEGEEPVAQSLAGGMSELSQAATAAVIASAFSAARTSGIPSHMTISRRSRGREEVSVSVDVDSHGNITHISENEANSGENASTDSGSPPAEAATAQDEAGPSRNNGSRRVRDRDYYTRTPALADVLDELAQLNARFQPYQQRFHEMVRTDPDFGTEAAEAAATANRLYSKVSQVMHYLSHAYHALSDIMCEFTQPPPRILRCRPVLIQHSAVLQAGIPISAQINVMTNRGSSSMPAPAAASSPPDSGSPEPDSQPTPSEGTRADPPLTVLEGLEIDGPSFMSGVVLELQTQEQPSAPPEAPATGGEGPATGSSQPSNGGRTRPVSGITGMPSAFSLSPGNVEFFMEVGPGSITIDSVEATLLPSSSGGGPPTVDTGVLGAMPWGSAPAPEFIHNLMQAVAGHMIRSNTGPQDVPTTTQPPTTAASSSTGSPTAANAPGQNSQARGNTATHPTTSTQTRSTSRPHVHLGSPVGGFGSNTFDQFLPCNSHHVRTQRRRAPTHFQRFDVEPADMDHSASEPRSQASQPSEQATTPPASDGQSMGIAQLFSGIMESLQTPPPAASTPAQAGAGSPPQQQAAMIFNMLQEMMTLVPSPNRVGAGGTTTQQSLHFPPGLLAQMLEGMEGLPVEGRSNSLADFMQSYFTDVGDRSYVEGESLLADLVMTLARNLSLRDVMNLSVGRSTPLNSVQPHLREFVTQSILQGGSPSSPNDVNRGIERLNSEFRPYLDVVLQARLREDIDVILTVNRYNQTIFTELIRLVVDDGGNFGGRLMALFRLYMREMFTILLHCCNDDIQGLEGITQSFVRNLTSGLPDGVQDWTIASSVSHMRAYVSTLNTPVSEVQRFLVYRAPPSVPEPPVLPTTAPALATPTTPAEEPMEMDAPAVEPFVPSDNSSEANGSSPIPVEPWHTAVPTDWVPIITRDVQRQRRQSPQAPFSDAYLAGMPSKRRKVVTSGKPTGNLNQVISEGVRNAVDTVGVAAPQLVPPPVDTVNQVVSESSSVQSAYRTQVMDSIGNTLVANSDFNPDQFPNSNKAFTRKK